jgi:hypothetical protein
MQRRRTGRVIGFSSKQTKSVEPVEPVRLADKRLGLLIHSTSS